MKTWREKLTANIETRYACRKVKRIDKLVRGKYTERYGWKQKHIIITWEHALRSLQPERAEPHHHVRELLNEVGRKENWQKKAHVTIKHHRQKWDDPVLIPCRC